MLVSRTVLDPDAVDTLTEIQNDVLGKQLERLWKTDFGDSLMKLTVSSSFEDTRVLEIIENSLKRVDGHYQVALPWRWDPPFLPNNCKMAERRCALSKKRLQSDNDLLVKYTTAMNDYLDKGHAEQEPKELEAEGKTVWYLPHHPVTHPLKKRSRTVSVQLCCEVSANVT